MATKNIDPNRLVRDFIEVAALLAWIASAPPELVLNEAIVTPLDERGWP